MHKQWNIFPGNGKKSRDKNSGQNDTGSRDRNPSANDRTPLSVRVFSNMKSDKYV